MNSIRTHYKKIRNACIEILIYCLAVACMIAILGSPGYRLL